MTEEKKHSEEPESSPEKAAEEEAATAGEEPEQSPPEKARDATGRGIPLILTFLFLVTLAIAGLGVWGWQLVQSELAQLDARQAAIEEQEAEQSERLGALGTKVGTFNPEAAARQAVGEVENRLDEALTDLSAEVDGLQGRLGALDASQEQLKKQQNSLDEAVGRIHDLIGRTQNGWLLAEVEYLLGMAQRRLLLANDLKSATRALQAADERLRELADPALLRVREAIAREITALNTYQLPDIDGMALRLKSAAEMVESLPPASEAGPEKEQLRAPKADEPEAMQPAGSVVEQAQQIWSRFRENISHLLVVRHHRREVGGDTEQADPLLVDRELHLQLLAARFALMERDQKTFERRLGNAVELLEDNYATEDPRVTELVDDLKTMRQEAQLKPPLPDISGSLQALRAATAEGKGE